ncbi:ATP-binding domain-containing protein [Microbacterium sp. CBS5P-1]|nr:ATP-binding domain-containing protein [Microbacterium excoecariae]
MVTSPGASFHLPAELAHKTGAADIGPDEEHFARIARALEGRRRDAERRLAAARRSGGRDGQSAMDRDIEIHQLSARLGVLERYGRDLCLGRIEPEGGDPLYIGRIGLTDPDGRRLLVDWRAPAAEPFFGATHAQPMGLAARRRYRWAGGRVVDYWDEVFAPDGGDARPALDDQSAFIRALSAARGPAMRDVLATIQADQDAIIRAPAADALVVDGGPGTGKTVVALHRAAYLLYADARISSSGGGGVLFVGPGESYLSYVDDVLPSLGEDSVRIATMRRLVPEGESAVPEASDVARRVKGAGDLERAIANVVRRYERAPDEDVVIQASWADVDIEPEDWEQAISACEDGTPHNEARDAIWEELLESLAMRVGEMPPHLARRELSSHPQLRAAFDAVWPVLDPPALVEALWADEDLLAGAAPWLDRAERGALRRPRGSGWTDADLPLLDAARELIGDPGLAQRRSAQRAALMAERERIETVVDYLSDADEDGEGVSLMLAAADMQERLVDDGAIPTVDHDALAGPFAHVVVDEAQELTDAEWRMLVRRCPSKSFTIVGDRAQARDGFASSWHDRLGRVGITRMATTGLSINYRTPAEIMSVAERAIREALPDANVPRSVRDSGEPVARGARSDLGRIVSEWLDAHEAGVLAVIGADEAPRHPRVRVIRAREAKGLEFDAVVLVDPDRLGTGIAGAVDRYVAMTRATQRLWILASEAEPVLTPA